MKFKLSLEFSKKVQLKKTSKLSKKGQLKIQEMAFMLVAVILFFILVGLFILTIILSNLSKEATEIAEAQTLTAIINLADSAEFSCIQGETKSNCVDADKVIALMNNRNYENFWPFSSLQIIREKAFDKKESEMAECTWANYPDCDRFLIYDKNVKNERAISSFVALCKKETEMDYNYDKCEIAKFIAGTELKRTGE